ncbi:hypothetical protein COCOBI_01-7720 [Coccomyxa sp. Obi]|nr:hypothetical protein COCOBI_01-7720 [Coccomyxa sp. Obi]
MHPPRLRGSPVRKRGNALAIIAQRTQGCGFRSKVLHLYPELKAAGMGRTGRAVLGLVLLAVCAAAQQAQAPAQQQQQQQQQMVASGPATTFTNMAQQVAQLSAFPNAPGTQHNTYTQQAASQASADASTQLQSTGTANSGSQAQRGQAQQYVWAPQAAPTTQTTTQAATSNQAATNPAQQANPNMPPQPPQLPSNGPVPNPQGAINQIGSVVQAAGSLASAQQALSSAGAAASSGDILQTVGQAAQAVQAVQKAAGDVGNAQKTIQSGGTYTASPMAQTVASPSPPTININIPGLGGHGGVQGPPGISYTAPTSQTVSQGAQQSSDPLSAIGSALAQAAFGGGLNQPAANTATLQAKNALGRKFA